MVSVVSMSIVCSEESFLLIFKVRRWGVVVVVVVQESLFRWITENRRKHQDLSSATWLSSDLDLEASFPGLVLLSSML